MKEDINAKTNISPSEKDTKIKAGAVPNAGASPAANVSPAVTAPKTQALMPTKIKPDTQAMPAVKDKQQKMPISDQMPFSDVMPYTDQMPFAQQMPFAPQMQNMMQPPVICCPYLMNTNCPMLNAQGQMPMQMLNGIYPQMTDNFGYGMQPLGFGKPQGALPSGMAPNMMPNMPSNINQFSGPWGQNPELYAPPMEQYIFNGY